MKKRYYFLFAFIFIVLVFLQPILYRSWGLNPDEGYFLFMGKSITNGAIPYIDYVDNKPPGIWYLMAANFQIFGTSFYTARYILYFTNALSVIIMVLIGIKINNRKTGVLAALFLLIGFLVPAYQGYFALTEPFLSFFSLLGLLFFLMGQKQKAYLVLCGFAIGLATLFKQTGLFLLASIGIFYLCGFWILENRNKHYILEKIKASFLLLIGFCIPILTVIVLFWKLGALHQFVHYSFSSLLGYGGDVPNYVHILYQFASFAVIWILAIISLAIVAQKFVKQTSDWKTMVSIWLILTFVPLLFRQYGHYYIQILPPACLLAAIIMNDLIPKIAQTTKEIIRNVNIKYVLTAGLGMIIVFLSVGASVAGYVVNRGEAMDSLQDQLQTASYVRAITEDNDKILVYPYEPSIYFLSDRNPCVTLLILYPTMGKDIESDLLQEIIDNEPRLVVEQLTSDNRVIMGLPLIYDFIVNHFHEIARMHAYIILGKE